MIEQATFAMGCFWTPDQIFSKIVGADNVAVGYTGGQTKNPTYEAVLTGKTGHAEAVQISFNPKKISYKKLLKIFWNNHDPTQLDGQGRDLGEQYRSIIFYHNKKQRELAEASKQELEAKCLYTEPIATEIIPATTFYLAEDYHLHYLDKRGLKGAC